MERESVEPSTVASVGYDAARRLLEIEFRSGCVYRYADVPTHVYEGLLDADSYGMYVNYHVIDRYPMERVA